MASILSVFLSRDVAADPAGPACRHFRSLDSLRVFDLIYVLTANSSDTRSMSVYARRLVDFRKSVWVQPHPRLSFSSSLSSRSSTSLAERVRLGADAAQ